MFKRYLCQNPTTSHNKTANRDNEGITESGVDLSIQSTNPTNPKKASSTRLKAIIDNGLTSLTTIPPHQLTILFNLL
jgi:hypothetical protein